jgi:hypothetical protein
MEKFNFEKHSHLLADLPFSFVSVKPFLECFGYVSEKNDSQELVIQNPENAEYFPYLYLPKNQLNWENSHFLWATDQDLELLNKKVKIIQTIPLGNELFYLTHNFTDPEGHAWHGFKRRINQFKKNYTYSVTEDAPKEKVEQFLKKWLDYRSSHDKKNDDHDASFFRFCLKNKVQFQIKTIFVFIEEDIVGVAMGVKLDSNSWVSIHLKADYTVKGLGRFLHQELAKLFNDCEYCSLGGEVIRSPGIKEFKHELNPIRTVPHFYVITGDKLS